MACPDCASTATTRRKGRTALGYRRFRCRACRRRFNERTGTPFNDQQYPTDIVLLAVLWRLRSKLGFRDVAELLLQRGFEVTHETIRAWEVRFGPLLADPLRAKRRGQAGGSWYLDETYVKVAGRWCYLYRAIDREGVLLDSMLSEHRDKHAARRFLRRLVEVTERKPQRVTTDQHPPYHRTIRWILGRKVVHRTNPYLNNLTEQDHRAVNVYPFVEAEQAGQRNVGKACALLEVSRAAYYQWSRHAPSARARADEVLGQRIERIHHDSRGTYGAPRVLAQLRRDGVCVGTRRVARLMRQHGLSGRCRRRFQRTAIPDPQAGTAAVDLLQRHFAAAALELNQAWCGDISYVRTWEGWLYLATVIDLASRRVVGWAMADHMRTTLVGDALRMAVASRRPPPGLIFHTDRGSQYTARDFTALLADHAIRQSLSRPRQCWDNAVAESWFATLKNELIYRRSWPTRAEARRAIFEFIEVFYNRRRLHSSLSYLSPAEYEAQKDGQPETAQAA